MIVPSHSFATPTAPRFGAVPVPKTEIEQRRLERYRDGLDEFTRTQHDPYRLVVVHDASGNIPLRSTLTVDWASGLENEIGKIVKLLNKGQLANWDDFEYAVVTPYRKHGGNKQDDGMPRRAVEDYDTFGVAGYGRHYNTQANAVLGGHRTHVFELDTPSGNIPMACLTKSAPFDLEGAQVTPADPSVQSVVKEELSRLYDHVRDLKPQIDAENQKNQPQLDGLLDDAVQTIARYHWVFAQAMPYRRGSAGIADMMTKTMFEHLGIAVPRWKEGLRPDLEAFTTPWNEFVEKYADYMAAPPAFYSAVNVQPEPARRWVLSKRLITGVQK